MHSPTARTHQEVVVITGASAGVGRATAHAFARRGAHIGLLARGRDGLEGARQDVEALGGKAIVVQTEVADAKLVDSAADAVEREFGPIDVWVNNAMTSVFSPIAELTTEEIKRVTEVTYLGTVHGTMAALSFAVGFVRYGLHEHVERISKAQFESASLFDFYRLPELFTGHHRDEGHPFPAHYPNANSPQAWSASTTWCLLQSMLGLYPYAPLNLLLLDPHLPTWLPEVVVRNLHVGAAVIDLRFHRTKSGESDYEVLDKRGSLHVVRQPSPWSLTATFGERLQDARSSLLPGK